MAFQVRSALSTPFPNNTAKHLPALGDAPDIIVADNIRAAQTLYTSAMLEEVELFSVVDRLVEQFSNGQLPLGRGNAGKRLYQYWKHASLRLNERIGGTCTRTSGRDFPSRT